MQFIVKPTSTSPSVVCKKFFRFHSTVVLITIGGLALFSTGFMFGLLWNMDGLCSSRLKSPTVDDEANQEINNQEAGLLRNDESEGFGGGDNMGKELTDVGLANGLIHLSSHLTTSQKQEIDLVILIMSAPGYKDRRDAIRESWINLIGSNRSIKYYFVMGTQSGGNLVLEHLKKEQEKFNDIIIFPHILDSYSTLSLKLLESLRWTYSRFNYKFILKVDDDSFVRIDKLYDELKSKKADSRTLYWGYFNGDANIKRQGKWTEDNWFLCDKYLPYALGGGYVISHSLVKYIVTNSHLLSLYHNEDVTLGVWLAPLNITRQHDPRFDTEYKSRGCSNNFLITHKQDTKEMRQKYDNIKQLGLLCKSQLMIRKAYFYNWKVAPSSCCFQNISLL
ncbi:beta-1,3-galactosyltransferase 6-like [Panonychus citri]|uniref:beta-1,3-galactosyltransferase 6-like n=1 Tax=Panonychus citri TaxID=50023 RepID=UPI002307D042|nr:beta-1,3-galactosyltransferase 6-like [Panonychus citri]